MAINKMHEKIKVGGLCSLSLKGDKFLSSRSGIPEGINN